MPSQQATCTWERWPPQRTLSGHQLQRWVLCLQLLDSGHAVNMQTSACKECSNLLSMAHVLSCICYAVPWCRWVCLGSAPCTALHEDICHDAGRICTSALSQVILADTLQAKPSHFTDTLLSNAEPVIVLAVTVTPTLICMAFDVKALDSLDPLLLTDCCSSALWLACVSACAAHLDCSFMLQRCGAKPTWCTAYCGCMESVHSRLNQLTVAGEPPHLGGQVWYSHASGFMLSLHM